MTQHRFDLPGADVTLFPFPYLGQHPDAIFKELCEITPWEQKSVVIYGVERPQPRLVAWYGDYGYLYSGLQLYPRPMTELLNGLSSIMTRLTGEVFNGVLLNLYQDGQHSIGMHSDDEPEFGPNPVIASLSLGAERTFDLERKDKTFPKVTIPLIHGSVLVMRGTTQQFWKHGVAKAKGSLNPRINLTFRNIKYPR